MKNLMYSFFEWNGLFEIFWFYIICEYVLKDFDVVFELYFF